VASANLELVRSIYAAWERGDFSSTDWAHPEIDFVIPDGPNPGRWRGLGGLAEGARKFLSPWEDFRFDAEEYELDEERVLVLTRRSGRGKTSGVVLEQMGSKGAALFELRGGEVTRLVFYFDPERASADLGLA
jgi:ketosteroid isomerase-like protein